LSNQNVYIKSQSSTFEMHIFKTVNQWATMGVSK
jgi:hypothetical protein